MLFRSPYFTDQTFYGAPVPTYIGGLMTLAWGGDDVAQRQLPVDELRKRYDAAGFKTRYYNPEVHAASFALPQFIQDALQDV